MGVGSKKVVVGNELGPRYGPTCEVQSEAGCLTYNSFGSLMPKKKWDLNRVLQNLYPTTLTNP